jgi:hypothetical protein
MDTLFCSGMGSPAFIADSMGTASEGQPVLPEFEMDLREIW